MSDSGSPQSPLGASGVTRVIVERVAEPVLGDLQAGNRAAADVLVRILNDGSLAAPLSAKPVGKLAAELLDSLPPPAHPPAGPTT